MTKKETRITLPVQQERLHGFIRNLVLPFLKKDKQTAKMYAEIVNRAKCKEIELSRDATFKLNTMIAEYIREEVIKAVKVLYLNKKGSRITDEVLEKAKEI